MDTDSTVPGLEDEPNTHLVSPEIQIVQDVEKDLEDYSRLGKLGRFGEAAKLFRETLHRHKGCFAVLVEHCHVPIEQGDFETAKLVIRDSIERQEMSVTGRARFATSELYLLRLLLIYATRCSWTNIIDDRAEVGLTEAHWFRTSITTFSPVDLTDAQRQILLMWLRIYFVYEERHYTQLEILRLPWSSRPAYPGEKLSLSDDYISWFETLLPKYPWDARVVLQHIGLLRPPCLYHQDWPVLLDMINRNFEHSASVDAILFARMSLLGTLCEVSLIRCWKSSGWDSDDDDDNDNSRIVTDSQLDRLVETIQQILHEHSENEEVTQTRAYKRLQLLAIDHELSRQCELKDAKKTIERIMPRLVGIEEFAKAPDIQDYQLSIDVLFHYYILTAQKDMRRVMLKKIAHFTSQFGNDGRVTTLRIAVLNDANRISWNRKFPQTSIVFMIMDKRTWSASSSTSRDRSSFEQALHDIEEEEREKPPGSFPHDQIYSRQLSEPFHISSRRPQGYLTQTRDDYDQIELPPARAQKSAYSEDAAVVTRR